MKRDKDDLLGKWVKTGVDTDGETFEVTDILPDNGPRDHVRIVSEYDEVHRVDIRNFESGIGTQYERPEKREEWIERLTNALLTGEDETFSRASAAMHLNDSYPSVFPIRDDEDGSWIVEAERETLDGTEFIGKIVTIKEDGQRCPECGNYRVQHSSWDNGIVGGFRESCTVCGYVHDEEAG